MTTNCEGALELQNMHSKSQSGKKTFKTKENYFRIIEKVLNFYLMKAVDKTKNSGKKNLGQYECCSTKGC